MKQQQQHSSWAKARGFSIWTMDHGLNLKPVFHLVGYVCEHIRVLHQRQKTTRSSSFEDCFHWTDSNLDVDCSWQTIAPRKTESAQLAEHQCLPACLLLAVSFPVATEQVEVPKHKQNLRNCETIIKFASPQQQSALQTCTLRGMAVDVHTAWRGESSR